MENQKQLIGSVEDIIFKNPDSGYIVFVLNRSDGQLITVNGVLGDVVEGEKLELLGEYENTPKYGYQFSASVCTRTPPSTPQEIRKYLSSGIIKGVGTSLAKKIVEAYGDEALDVIENDPLRLAELKGVTSDRALYISSEYRKLSGVKNVVEFLQQYGISPAVAAKVWQKFESSSVNLLKENPYILYDDEIGVDFETADEIALSQGIKENDIKRVETVILYILKENLPEGNSCLPLSKVIEIAVNYTELGETEVQRGIDEALKKKYVEILPIKERNYLYLYEYYRAETYIAERLAEMVKTSDSKLRDLSEEIAGVEFTENIQYETLQKAAISGCMCNKVFILTGGPGTGKTTTLNGVIQLIKKRKQRFSLAAPTGRAAKRMSEVTGQPASTIHRLLEVDFSSKDKPVFKRNEKKPLGADVVIIDEMSMVDVLLFESLLRAIKPSASLIMVGDCHQLPSVGPGRVFHDLIITKKIPMVELTEIFRQAAESLIVTNAHRIVKGQEPILNDRKNDFFFMECEKEAAVSRLIIELTKTRLPNAYGYSPLEDIQILTPTKLGWAGTKELNKSLQLALNPPSKDKREITVFDNVFRVSDKVMQTKNDYDIEWKKGAEYGRGVFNGDIGFIEEINDYSGDVIINYDGKRATYKQEMMRKVDLAYAITIHKSQGSEYNAVIMPLCSVSPNLLYRNLLYTGVTRAKKILIIVGTKDQVYTMLKNNRGDLRFSCVGFLLRDNEDIQRLGGN